jgi:hypothetical protein
MTQLNLKSLNDHRIVMTNLTRSITKHKGFRCGEIPDLSVGKSALNGQLRTRAREGKKRANLKADKMVKRGVSNLSTPDWSLWTRHFRPF